MPVCLVSTSSNETFVSHADGNTVCPVACSDCARAGEPPKVSKFTLVHNSLLSVVVSVRVMLPADWNAILGMLSSSLVTAQQHPAHS